MSRKTNTIVLFAFILLIGCDMKNLKVKKVDTSNPTEKPISNTSEALTSLFKDNNIVLNKNKTYVVNFGETWCVPCIREFEQLNTLKSKLSSDTNVVFLYITKSKEVEFQKIKTFAEFNFLKTFESNLYDSICKLEVNKNSLISVESCSLPMTIVIKNNVLSYKFLDEITIKNIDEFTEKISPIH